MCLIALAGIPGTMLNRCLDSGYICISLLLLLSQISIGLVAYITQMYSLTVLEIRSLNSTSLGKSEGSATLVPSGSSVGRICFLVFFQLLAACMPWLGASSSIFKRCHFNICCCKRITFLCYIPRKRTIVITSGPLGNAGDSAWPRSLG